MKATVTLTTKEIEELLTLGYEAKKGTKPSSISVGTRMECQGYGTNERDVAVVDIELTVEI